MEVPELNLKECESVFVRDEFYENIQAPKFHDFCSNDDPVVDAEGYFRRLGGRSPRPSTDPYADQNSFWGGTKESTVLKPPGLPKAPLSSVALNTDVTSSVPKASSAGLKKAKPPVPMLANPLTKSHDKAPSKNKTYHRVSSVSNASLSSTTSDGKGHDSVQAPSTVKSCHASENTDPNGNLPGKRKKVINSGGFKLHEGITLTASAGPGPVRAPSHGEVDSKAAIDKQAMVKSQTQIPKPSKEKSESTAGKVTDQDVVEPCDVKDRKRKPTTRNAEAGLSKFNESKSRDVKQQRKCSSFPVQEISDLAPSSSQSVRATCSGPVRASTVKPAADRRASRRSSDNSRRRRASGTLNARQGRRVLLTGPRSNANAAQETTGDIAAQLPFSLPGPCGSEPTNKEPSVLEEEAFIADGCFPPKSTLESPFVFSGPIVTPSSIAHATEVSSLADDGSLNLCTGGASNFQTIEVGDSAGESVQTLVCGPDTSMIPVQQEVRTSVGDILLEKLQKLHLQQADSRPLRELESNNELAGLRTPSCVISTDDSLMSEEIKYSSGIQIECPKEHNEETMPMNNLHAVGAGICARIDIEVGETEYCMDSSKVYLTSGVVPGEGEEEYDTTVDMGNQDIDLPEGASVSKMCWATTVSGACMVEEIDEAGVLESLQNLQIQSSGSGMSESKLPCDEDAGRAISRGSCVAVGEEHSDMVLAAENCNEMLQSHNPVLAVECNTAASSTQEVKIGNETRSLKRLLSKGPSRVAQYTEIDLSSSNGHHVFITDQQKRNNKRKSIELGPHRNEQKSTNTTAIPNFDEQRKAKIALQSSLASLMHPQLSSSVSRVAIPCGISGQHKKMKTTCPQPFRLRTEERGALKEVEFNKKVELYLAAKEKMQNVPFQFATNKDSRVPRNASKDNKMSAKQIRQHTQARAAERALFDMKVTEKSLRADEEKHEKEKRMQLEAEEEIKRMRKQMIPHAQRMPFFDRPFKPQRSTKTLTVPSSPKFHSLKAKKA